MPVNPLDLAALEHDKVYVDEKGNRRKADRILAERAFTRMLAGVTPGDERTLAMMTASCMVSKITFEKFFSRITKAIRWKKQEAKKKIAKSKKPV